MKLASVPRPFCCSPSGQRPGQHNLFELFLETFEYEERNDCIGSPWIGLSFYCKQGAEGSLFSRRLLSIGQIILLSKALRLCIFNETCFISDVFGSFPVDSDND